MAPAPGRARQDLIRFGEFELDLLAQTLSQRGVRTKLQRQPFQVLELLIQRAPAIVSREEIRTHVWGTAVHIDAAQSINFCVRQIRLALGDSSAESHFIETLPRQGYRFIAAVEGGVHDRSVAEPTLVQEPLPGLSRGQWLIPASLCVLGLTALLALWGWWSLKRNTTLGVARITPITTYQGMNASRRFRPTVARLHLPGEAKTETTATFT